MRPYRVVPYRQAPMPLRWPYRHLAGFTVLDFVVLFVVLVLLVMIFLPIHHAHRVKPPQTVCLNNQRQIANALLIWTLDHQETFPPPSRKCH